MLFLLQIRSPMQRPFEKWKDCSKPIRRYSGGKRKTIRHEFGIDHVSTIPTGVDTDFYCPSGNDCQPGRLAFVGSMDWDPNEDGVVWFLESIYPLIRKAVPNASFVVVGRNPSSRLRAIAAK